MRFQKNKSIKRLTTIKIGGYAKLFCLVKNWEELIISLNYAKNKKLSWNIIGDGSNIIASDKGFNGLLIKIGIQSFKRKNNRVLVGAGNNLFNFIRKINGLGLSGLEKMAGIPGTIGGAIYGNAGAYGQEISVPLKRVRIFDQRRVRWISKKQCFFNYRESIFKKKKNWIILEADFTFKVKEPNQLIKISQLIIKLRNKKYWPSLLCPGSFFKNIYLNDLKPTIRKKLIKKIDSQHIIYGKIPAGYLLELVKAKGRKCGGIKIAKHHANLFYNTGFGKAREIKRLADILRSKVYKAFEVNLEEEVQYLPPR